jgi:hypothetical protein
MLRALTAWLRVRAFKEIIGSQGRRPDPHSNLARAAR